MGWLVSLNSISVNFCMPLHGSVRWPTIKSTNAVQSLFSSPALIECWDFLEKKYDFLMDLGSRKKYILFWLTPLPPMTPTYFMDVPFAHQICALCWGPQMEI